MGSSEKMRILVISNYYPPLEIGGWGQLTCDVTDHLSKRGHQTYVITSNYRASQITKSEPGIARILHLESPDHVNYRPYYTLTYRWTERQNQRYLAQEVSRFRPDIIFINGMWNLPHSVAWQLEQLCPGRVVYYIASYWPTELDAHRAYWLTSWEQSRLRLPKKWIGELIAKMFLSGPPRNQLDFTLVLCVSAFMQDHIVEKAGVPRSQTRVVHNGIDPATFAIRSFEKNGATLRLLYAGRLSPDKGVHTAIEGMGHLLKSQPTLPITLSIVGSGTEAYEANLKQLVTQFNLADIVHFKGQVSRDQMPAIVAEHDVLLLPSIWPEPLARMTQEGMACGLVVIGTTTGGTPEILHDGKNGLTFEAGNALMLADKIAQIAHDPKLKIKMAQAARQTVEERFTFERMVDEIEHYFTSILNQKELVIE